MVLWVALMESRIQEKLMLMMLKLEELMLVVVIAVLPWQISFFGHGLGIAEAPWEGLVDEDGRSDLLAQLSFHVPCKTLKSN